MYNVPQTGYLMLRNMGLVPTERQWKLDGRDPTSSKSFVGGIGCRV